MIRRGSGDLDLVRTDIGGTRVKARPKDEPGRRA